MDRLEMSGADIQTEVTRLVHQIEEVRASHETIAMPLPAHLAGLDLDGCNWYMAYGGMVGIHGHAVRDVIDKVKAEWNLAR